MALSALFPVAGLQDFIDEASNAKLTATSSAGAPPSGQFYSSIVGRAAITDITKDMKPSFGIERVMIQTIYRLESETGPSNELVWAVAGDDRGLVRFVGSGWFSPADTFGGGPRPATGVSNDYVEITFYGTGLNLLTVMDSATRTFTVSINGGAGVNYSSSGYSSILTSRGQGINSPVTIAGNLPLGVYTAKITSTSGSNGLNVYGYEVLNTNSSTLINVNPGSAFYAGQKINASASKSLAYNSAVTGTKGGRIVTYIDSSGNLGQAFTPVAASSNFLTSTDHANEEVVRVYAPREFSASRSDDWSGILGTNITRAFTLEDGTTTFTASSAGHYISNGVDGISAANSNSWQFTFVGTGLDMMRTEDTTGTMGTMTITVDGVSVGSLDNVGVANRTRIHRICSGLPYGTHTVRLALGATGAGGSTSRFIVYQPKKPSIPAGAVELADYNVMATYVPNTTTSLDTVAAGVLRKQNSREWQFVEGSGGTTSWTISAVQANSTSGFDVFSDRTNCQILINFFGTGFELRGYRDTNRSAAINVQLAPNNGSFVTCNTTNFPNLQSASAGFSFNTSTGVLSLNGSALNGAGISIYGLPLAQYTLRLQTTTAAYLSLCSFDAITPIHGHKPQIGVDYNNTMPIGSCSLSDSRKTTPIKDIWNQKKNIAQATGVVSSPTTTSTSNIPMPDMSVVHYNTTGKIKVSYSMQTAQSVASGYFVTAIYVDGVQWGNEKVQQNPSAGTIQGTVSDSFYIPVTPGYHKVDIYWRTSSGTATAPGTVRNMLVEEI